VPQSFLSPEASAEGDAQAFFQKLDFKNLNFVLDRISCEQYYGIPSVYGGNNIGWEH
jgi:hypothetical protein